MQFTTLNKCVATAALAMAPVFGLFAQSKFDDGLAAALGQASLAREGHVSGIIMLGDRVDAPKVATSIVARSGQRTTRQERHERVVRALQAKAAATQPALLAKLRNMPGVRKAQGLWITNAIIIDAMPSAYYELQKENLVQKMYLDYPIETIMPLDEGISVAPAATNGEPGLRGINAHLLWAEGITGKGRLVSHLDTGVDGNHPALRNTWRGNKAGVRPGWAWFDPLTNTTTPFDAGSHGTHTMGTIVGRAGNDIIGVAYDAEWISAGVIDRGGINATIQNALLAFQWSADPDGNPSTVDDVPDVSSNSWGLPLSIRPGCDQTFWEAIDNLEAATVVAVFAAGNEGRNGAQSLRTPADRNTTGINAFSVGSLGTDGQSISSFSSRGPSACTRGNRIKPEVVARGSSVRSAVPGNRYSNFSGTSMATPHVAGAVALLRQVDPNATVAQIKRALMRTARDLGSTGNDNTFGRGKIDVYAAAQRLRANQLCGGSPCLVGVDAVAKPTKTIAATAAGFEKAFSLYPNPAQNNVTLNYNFEAGAPSAVRIYAHDGRLAREVAITSQSTKYFQFELDGLRNGLYLIQLVLPSGATDTQRLSIKR